jgi:hypothetical protein
MVLAKTKGCGLLPLFFDPGGMRVSSAFDLAPKSDPRWMSETGGIVSLA